MARKKEEEPVGSTLFYSPTKRHSVAIAKSEMRVREDGSVQLVRPRNAVARFSEATSERLRRYGIPRKSGSLYATDDEKIIAKLRERARVTPYVYEVGVDAIPRDQEDPLPYEPICLPTMSPT